MVDNLFKIFKNNNIDFLPLIGNESTWDSISSNLNYLPVEYTLSWITYQNEYLKNSNKYYTDCSIIIKWDNIFCGLLPLSIKNDNDNLILISHTNNILPPLFLSDIGSKSYRKILSQLLVSINLFCKENKFKKIEYTEIQYRLSNISKFHELLISENIEVKIEYEMFVDLQYSINEIKSNFRDSYKSLINSSKRLWDTFIQDNFDKKIWEEFKNLHFEVSGKKTRSDLTWELQHEAIKEKKAILIYLRDQNGDMIGGGFFNFSKDESIYSVGAYKRELFDKPIGHLIQFQAIEYFKENNIKKYRIGKYVINKNLYTEKEISISYFKKGFCNTIIPRYIYTKHI